MTVRKLTLRRDALAVLADDDLAVVAAGAPGPTFPTFPVTCLFTVCTPCPT